MLAKYSRAHFDLDLIFDLDDPFDALDDPSEPQSRECLNRDGFNALAMLLTKFA